jgi:hypothetical protein
MSQEHDTPSSEDAPLEDGISPVSPPFEPAYQPETLPKISVPDLPDDAEGLSVEALAQVPTLTELVDDAPGQELLPTEPAAAEAAPVALESPVSEPLHESASDPVTSEIQAEPAQADTWVQELQVRMGKLNSDIHSLNARLDRLEERNKKKA